MRRDLIRYSCSAYDYNSHSIEYVKTATTVSDNSKKLVLNPNPRTSLTQLNYGNETNLHSAR